MHRVNTASEQIVHRFLDIFAKNCMLRKSNARPWVMDEPLGASVEIKTISADNPIPQAD